MKKKRKERRKKAYLPERQEPTRRSKPKVFADEMLPVRDGIRLATDIYLPAGQKEPLPAILVRTPYGKGSYSQEAAFWTSHGYGFVVQDCRGRFNSEGEFHKYINEGPDGYDTVEWIAKQRWSNGKVGTTGVSYMSHVQQAMAVMNPPHLKAMFQIQGGFSNAFLSGTRQGGAIELKVLTWAFGNLCNAVDVVSDKPWLQDYLKEKDFSPWLTRLPLRRGQSPLALSPQFERYVFEEWQRGEYDDYWRQIGLNSAEYYDQYPKIPVLFMGGWYDQFSRTAVENFQGAQKSGWRSDVRLVMGPWTHGGFDNPCCGEVDFGEASRISKVGLAEDCRNLQRRWFDCWLKNQGTGAERDKQVLLFVMGGGSGRKDKKGHLEHGGKWVWMDTWPSSNEWPLYLHPDGGLSSDVPGGDGFTCLVADAENPVPTIGGPHGLHRYSPPGPFDQVERKGFLGCREPYLPLSSRPDVLIFETAPLKQAVMIAGTIRAHLWVSSSAKDTDLTANLVDVYPSSPDYAEGFALVLTDGILRLRYRNGYEKPEFLPSGEVVAIEIEMLPTANLFAKGHRIRLDIAGSNFPKFDVNSNTGEALGRERRKERATNHVHHTAQYPSHLLLPLLEYIGGTSDQYGQTYLGGG